MKWLWPIETGKTIFDVWTIAHIAFWTFACATMAAFKEEFGRATSIVLCASLTWELFERFAEKQWPHIWMHPETAINSYVGDVLVSGLLGLFMGYWIVANQ